MRKSVVLALLALAACDGPPRDGHMVGWGGLDRLHDEITAYEQEIERDRYLPRYATPAPPLPWVEFGSPDFSGHYDISPVVLDHPEFGREFSGPGFSCTQAPLLMGRRDLGSTIDCD